MTENFLLVPMQIDAMVLNQMASITTPFLRFQMQYRNLQSFNTPEPRPFAGGSTKQPDAGIYLHWTLPKALRHGRHRDDGSTEFPLVPNRWLIARTQEGIAPERAVKAWILESDHLDARTGTSPFVDPNKLSAGGTPTPVKIGRALRLTPSLKTLAVQKAPFLRAVGPGSVYFSLFSPGVENVFSFYDDVTENDDKSAIAAGRFTYTVIGWYSDPAHDPLAPTSWSASTDPAHAGAYDNDTFDWRLYMEGAAPPKQMLVHTLVSGVPWNRGGETPPAAHYPKNIRQEVKVAVGNTAVDALAGMVRLARGSEAEADLLEAFQYGLLEELDQPGSSEALNMAIRQQWFGASPSGTLWEIVPRERRGDTATPAPPPPVITPVQGAALAALNRAQSELDRERRLLESMQWNLLSLWWKYNWQNSNTPPLDADMQQWIGTQLALQVGIGSTCNHPKGSDPAAEEWYACKVAAQKNRVAALATAAGREEGKVTAILAAEQELKSTSLPEYHYPNDPVVMVTGLGRSTNFDPGRGLLCRLPSQSVSALTVGGTAYALDPTQGTGIAGRIPPLADPNGLLPAGAQALHAESFFLSPTLFASAILGDAGGAEEVRAGIRNLPKPACGARFAPPSHATAAWVQPWVPLLLDWEITLLKQPAYSCKKGEPTCTLNQEHWSFDGTDYRWTGPTAATGGDFDEADSLQMQLRGRTFVTPQISFTLADQLRTYVKEHKLRDPDLQKLLEDLDRYIGEIQQQDILSQRLSGAGAMMIGRNYTQGVAPTGSIAELIGTHHRGYPLPSPTEHATYAPAIWNFAPMRGTFFVINRLSVIDIFGRTIDLMLANNSSSPQTQGSVTENYFYPITGRDVKSPTAKDPRPGLGISSNPTERMIQLGPRMVQDARVAFHLTSNDGANADIHHVAGGSPVCGWVVPNHLDRSLAFYAPDGTAWGELYLSLRTRGGYTPVWQPDPTSPTAPQRIEEIPNGYVREMLRALSARTDNGQGFADFIKAIDETLWTINPLGHRKDQNLSVLIGRPLALVRTEISLNLRGLPAYNQDWWNTFAVDPENPGDPEQPAPLAAVDGGIASNLWPVRLGSPVLRDDGLIGYFLDDPTTPAEGFRTFNTLRMPAGSRSDYLKAIGTGNYLRLRAIDDTVTPDPKRNQLCRMTMLVDPRGSIHAFSGLLPVFELEIPSRFVKPAIEKMFFTFRAGPFLTSPDEVRIPRPAEQQGTWAWFDNIIKTSVPIVEADGKVRFPTTPSLIKEGWLKFTPNPPKDHE